MAIAAAIPYILLITSAVGAYAAVQQGRAANAAGKYNAAVAEQNAQLSRQQALEQSAQQDRENFMRLGSIRAAQGKTGGVASEGSVLDIIGQAASQGELQKQYIMRAGEAKARGLEGTAQLESASGKNAQTTAYLTAGSELLGGGIQAYGAQQKLNPNATPTGLKRI